MYYFLVILYNFAILKSMLSCVLYKYKFNSERKQAFFAVEGPNSPAKAKCTSILTGKRFFADFAVCVRRLGAQNKGNFAQIRTHRLCRWFYCNNKKPLAFANGFLMT